MFPGGLEIHVFPVIGTGADNIKFLLTANVFAELDPQALLDLTLTLPEVLPKVTVIEVVPWPSFITVPEGRLHLYDVAFATSDI